MKLKLKLLLLVVRESSLNKKTLFTKLVVPGAIRGPNLKTLILEA
jgi:hypothetical protein